MDSNGVGYRWHSIGAIVLALAALIVAGLTMGAKGRGTPIGENGQHVGITVSGHSERMSSPDTAYVSLGVVVREKKVRDAVDRNARIAQAVTQAIRRQGIAAKDIQTRDYSVQPWVKYDKNYNAKQLGYEVSNTVRVTVTDMEKAPEVIDAGTRAGANSVKSLSFGFADEEKMRQDILRAAVANAREKAEVVANGLGVKVGGPLSVKEGTAEEPMPRTYMLRKSKVAARLGDYETPISPGELKVTQDVEVTFEIAP